VFIAMKIWIRGVALVALGAALTIPDQAEAQVQVAIEPRVGVTFPTGDLSSDGAEAGLALGAELMFNIQRNLTAYVGLNRHGFTCDRDCDLGRSPRSEGIGAGLKVILPSPPDALVWARGGILAHRYSDSQRTSARNLGFEVGTGIDMPIRPRTYLTPHLGILSHDAGSLGTATWVNFGLGLHYHF
jgi:hypothetical protein